MTISEAQDLSFMLRILKSLLTKKRQSAVRIDSCDFLFVLALQMHQCVSLNASIHCIQEAFYENINNDL